MKAPILITGCARSGTSMTAGIIAKCGAYGGHLIMGNSKFNRKGFFENREVRENIIKPYLMLCGADPMGQRRLPDTNKLLPLANLREHIEEIYKIQGLKKNVPWFYKGAKMTLIWPIFHKAFPDAKWIVARRKDEDIVYSCLRTGFMRAYNDEAGWQSWVDWHKQRFEDMKANGLDLIEVWPSKYVNGDFAEIKMLINELGLEWNEDAVKDFVSPALWRTKHGK